MVEPNSRLKDLPVGETAQCDAGSEWSGVECVSIEG